MKLRVIQACNSETIGLWDEKSKKSIWPHKENQIWRVKTNEELDKLIEHKNMMDIKYKITL
jgi:hypothetical protein